MDRVVEARLTESVAGVKLILTCERGVRRKRWERCAGGVFAVPYADVERYELVYDDPTPEQIASARDPGEWRDG